jgi:hypothetical protein
LSRAKFYYRAVRTGAYELELMALIDRQFLQTPFYGSRADGSMASGGRAMRLNLYAALGGKGNPREFFQPPAGLLRRQPDDGARTFPTRTTVASKEQYDLARNELSFAPDSDQQLFGETAQGHWLTLR